VGAGIDSIAANLNRCRRMVIQWQKMWWRRSPIECAAGAKNFSSLTFSSAILVRKTLKFKKFIRAHIVKKRLFRNLIIGVGGPRLKFCGTFIAASR
jgi:hypothetical protein